MTLILGGTLCFITYLYLALLEARKTPLRLSPLSFFFAWYSIGMGLSPLYVGLVTDSQGLIRFASDSSQVPLDDLAYGYTLFLIGSLALHLGMHLFRPKVTADSPKRPAGQIVWWFAVVWVVGLLFQLRPTLFSSLGSLTKIFAVALVGSVCGLAVTPREKLKLSKSGFVAVVTVGTAGLLFGNLSSGSKAYIMFSFLPLTWFFLLSARRVYWIAPLAIALASFYFAVVAPVVYTDRQRPLQEGESARQHMIESFDSWLKEKPEELNQSFFAEQLDQFLNRQFDAVPVGFIVGEAKAKGFLAGETLQYAGYAFIPRVLWPDKPNVTRGAWFSTYLGLFQSESEATTSIGMSAIGELYWNFGIGGVVVGMFALGCLQGVLWRMAGNDPRGRPIHMLLYVSILLSMTDMPDALTVLVALVVSYLTFKAAFLALDVANRRGVGLGVRPKVGGGPALSFFKTSR